MTHQGSLKTRVLNVFFLLHRSSSRSDRLRCPSPARWFRSAIRAVLRSACAYSSSQNHR